MILSLAKAKRWVLALLVVPLVHGLIETNMDYWVGARIIDDADLLRLIRGCREILCYLNS